MLMYASKAPIEGCVEQMRKYWYYVPLRLLCTAFYINAALIYRYPTHLQITHRGKLGKRALSFIAGDRWGLPYIRSEQS